MKNVFYSKVNMIIDFFFPQNESRYYISYIILSSSLPSKFLLEERYFICIHIYTYVYIHTDVSIDSSHTIFLI